ncbi:hypothetical protein QBC44DRAFT_323987 [Cladorrhinum sp. PSN332]|nr:hypothetical protein QBC44DRAFT_323987 [Cladorrhinum sp. PSN332]
MAGSIIALSLMGLGAVQALPAPQTIEERQIWIGDGSGVFIPGIDQPVPPCLVDGSSAPQAPCLLPFIPGGGIIPPGTGGGSIVPGYGGGGDGYPGDGGEDDFPEDGGEEESQVEKRQIWIGDGTGIFIPGQGDFPSCLKDVPLKEQKPCLLGPISTFPKNKRGIQVRQTLIGGGGGFFVPGIGLSPLPTCATGVPLSQQPPCLLPPIDGNGGLIWTPPKEKRQFTLLPPDAAANPKKAIEQLQKELIALQNKRNKTKADLQKIKDLKAALLYLAGITNISAPPGSGSSFTPGKRSFKLPPDATTNPKRVIEELEGELIALQNKPHKTKQDLEDIAAIKGALKYLANIIDIQAPPGTGSTFTPGKRDLFKLPPDAASNPKKAIETLELTLIGLQNKRHKTKEDIANIHAIKEALKYLAGIIDIQAPPGTGSTFTPGKRDLFKLPPDAASNPKKAIETLELTLIGLQNKRHKTKEDLENIAAIKAALKYLAGIIDIQAPPGTGSTFTPGKRAFVLPPDATTNTKKVLEKLELDLIALQNKRFKTKEDWADIKAIKAALLYLAGITNISAPPGTGSTFTPGK